MGPRLPVGMAMLGCVCGGMDSTPEAACWQLVHISLSDYKYVSFAGRWDELMRDIESGMFGDKDFFKPLVDSVHNMKVRALAWKATRVNARNRCNIKERLLAKGGGKCEGP